jgi:hypothetical protein
MARRRSSLRRLEREVAKRFPDIPDPCAEIAAGRIAVDGRIAANPATWIRPEASVSRRVDTPLRGEAKLRAALAAFAVDTAGRIAVDCGAAAGGFTRVLLAAGVRRVYAVDAGYGQMRGFLRGRAGDDRPLVPGDRARRAAARRPALRGGCRARGAREAAVRARPRAPAAASRRTPPGRDSRGGRAAHGGVDAARKHPLARARKPRGGRAPRPRPAGAMSYGQLGWPAQKAAFASFSCSRCTCGSLAVVLSARRLWSS